MFNYEINASILLIRNLEVANTFFAPRNLVLIATSNPCPPTTKSVKAKQARSMRAKPKASVISYTGASRTKKSVNNELGASGFSASKTMHIRWFPWKQLLR